AAARMTTNTPTTPTRLRLNRAEFIGERAQCTNGAAHLPLSPAAGRMCSGHASAHLQDDLPELALVFQAALRVGGALERKHLVDDRRDTAVEAQLRRRIALCEAPHVAAEQRQLAREEMTQIERGGEAAGRAARDQAPAGGEREAAEIPGRLDDVIDDAVDAASAG